MVVLTGKDSVLTRDPFAEIDRLFGDMFRSPDSLPNRFRRGVADIGTTKAEDIGDHRIIKVILPGVSPENLELDIQGNYLRWRAETNDEEGSFISRAQGNYHLGSNLDTEKVEADLTNGILTVSIAHREKPEAKRINVGTGGSLAQDATKHEAISERSPTEELRSSIDRAPRTDSPPGNGSDPLRTVGSNEGS